MKIQRVTSAVLTRTSPVRAPIIVRSASAVALRCFTGHGNSRSIRASRARVRASQQPTDPGRMSIFNSAGGKSESGW